MAAKLRAQGVDDSRIISESFVQAHDEPQAATIRKYTYQFAAVALVLAVAFIGTLDLMRTVPKLAAQQLTNQTTSQSPITSTVSKPQAKASDDDTPTVNTTPSSDDSTTSSTSPTVQTPTTSPPTTTPTTTTPPTTYQQPVSRVS
jgi:cytoskeletal protein RodZ